MPSRDPDPLVRPSLPGGLVRDLLRGVGYAVLPWRTRSIANMWHRAYRPLIGHPTLSLETLAVVLSYYLRALAMEIDGRLLRRRLRSAGLSTKRRTPTWTSKAELRALFFLAANSPPNAAALEIGSYLGASTRYLAAGLAQVNGQLYCLDTWRNDTMPEGERDTFADFMAGIEGLERWITAVRRPSGEVSTSDVPVPLDLVFIDGDHSYEAVKRDFELSESLVSSDGLIAFHDSNAVDHKDVSRVIGEALASGTWMIEGHVDSLLWMSQVPEAG